MKKIFFKWFTKPNFERLSRQIDMTLDYLESVSKREAIEAGVVEDLEKLESWVFDDTVRKETVLEYKQRYLEIQQKRLP